MSGGRVQSWPPRGFDTNYSCLTVHWELMARERTVSCICGSEFIPCHAEQLPDGWDGKIITLNN